MCEALIPMEQRPGYSPYLSQGRIGLCLESMRVEYKEKAIHRIIENGQPGVLLTATRLHGDQ